MNSVFTPPPMNRNERDKQDAGNEEPKKEDHLSAIWIIIVAAIVVLIAMFNGVIGI